MIDRRGEKKERKGEMKEEKSSHKSTFSKYCVTRPIPSGARRTTEVYGDWNERTLSTGE